MRPRSLTWRLVGRLAGLQAVTLTLLILVIGAVAIGLLRAGLLIGEYEGSTLDTLRDALTRNEAGRLMLRETPELAALRAEHADLWFIVRDAEGQQLSEGMVPTQLAPITSALDHVSEARLKWNAAETARPAGLVKWVDTPAGRLQILTGTYGELSMWRALESTPLLFLNMILPIVVLMTLATLVATPFVVRRAMTGLAQVAAQAERIDIDQRGVQLPLDTVPVEIVPLVKAINAALGRLDKGYERHRRFLAAAAHELRTPIAILSARVASLQAGLEKTRLLEDATRLSVLAGQLLDLQRLDQQTDTFVEVDLVGIARQVVLDLAPLAFAAGYEMSFEQEDEAVVVSGDHTSLERALTNLVQNAIDHGQRRGTILVRVTTAGRIEVHDDGNGIPPDEREQIFEPFRRLHPGGRGAGLGLDLVQTIMRLHGGRIEVDRAPSGGACMRMVFATVQPSC
ncbi:MULTISPECIES: sensor histidine kinase [Bradyrhizobium]|uniref:sensor histidine kinase n=1 Tax=Bradyrhizobium TaxID=374 RepID=UPI00038036F9|nr:HAMP domain-containing sensor histidine kinase [Bradyrhizobium elkanii]NWL41181.1 HAMP domain-containing histidine kinase [Bradyrhizobium elkanii]NWL69942.1 HAMP domain-containing histidine kinase [Bradyrhizobium elkanii]OIM96033.1 two-component sensor histidine kinase [Bradyrhizobium elkanii]RYM30191.1 HAMP domain-containing histidine kinase [Bradyrhizobium elkanii]UQD85943.1 HAMP domain-containing histidine kinase [Bradyrhizobium elkanii USDA 76]